MRKVYIISVVSCCIVVVGFVGVLIGCCIQKRAELGKRFSLDLNQFGARDSKRWVFTLPPTKKHAELVDLDGGESIETDLLGT